MKARILLPGDQVELSSSILLGEGLFRDEKGFVYSTTVGYLKIVTRGRQKIAHVIPLKKIYLPKVGDIVIGKVVEIGLTYWLIDINSPYTAILPLSEVFSRPVDVSRIDLSKSLSIGDVIVAKVIEGDLTREPVLTVKESKLGKAPRGVLLELRHDILRKILENFGGEKGLIKAGRDYSCDVIVGKNFRILIIGKDVESERTFIHHIMERGMRNEVRKN